MTNERMTKVYNTRETMPDDMIAGYVAAYPAQIALGANPRVVRRKKLRTHGDKVAVLIGNGSGHEPIAMGFVGALAAGGAYAGSYFTRQSFDSANSEDDLIRYRRMTNGLVVASGGLLVVGLGVGWWGVALDGGAAIGRTWEF